MDIGALTHATWVLGRILTGVLGRILTGTGVLGRILTGTAARGSLIAWFLASVHGSQRVALSAGSHCVASSCDLSVWLSVLGSEIAT
jgi:hypothetical protein